MTSISVFAMAGDFAEDKDVAAHIRDDHVTPALQRGRTLHLSFEGVTLVTQSFVHALISEPLRTHGEKALDLLVFEGCSTGVRGIIETVVQYSLETMDENGEAAV